MNETFSAYTTEVRYTTFTKDEVLHLLGIVPREGWTARVAIYDPLSGRPWQLVVSQHHTEEKIHAGPAGSWPGLAERDGDQRYDERGRPVIDDD
jgi:hypothetical protein